MAQPASAAGPASSGRLHVVVISPEKTIYDGEADSVVAPGADGELGILRGHAPLMTLLGAGDIRVKSGGKTERFHVEGGFLQVIHDVVTVLSEQADAAGE
jgi:F-type H+-transporting ATPase subunit epsilon